MQPFVQLASVVQPHQRQQLYGANEIQATVVRE